MEQQKNNVVPPIQPGIVPMARIDGARIRRLREEKGLTQLYLSTVVGVTTDTISRWENRHYQTVKLDNAEKLAAALEVALEEIREQAGGDGAEVSPRPVAGPEDQPRAGPRRLHWMLMAAATFAVAVVALLFYALFPQQPPGEVSAQRILPPQVPPGQNFPVLIRVRTAGLESMSLILKETVPDGCKISQAVPAPAAEGKGTALKWIGRSEAGESVYAYLCQVPAGAAYGETLAFSGTVTRKQSHGREEGVGGATALIVAPFHWADANRDQVIDDAEILALYDLYGEIRDLDYDRDRVDALWAGGGYRWDERKRKYMVREH